MGGCCFFFSKHIFQQEIADEYGRPRRMAAQHLASILAGNHGAKILDLGAGTGLVGAEVSCEQASESM